MNNAKKEQPPAPGSNLMKSPHQIKMEQLHELFIGELTEMFWSEKALVRVLPKIAKTANSPSLEKLIGEINTNAELHVSKINEILDQLKREIESKKNDITLNFLKDTGIMIEAMREPAIRDMGLVSALRKIEYYKYASYQSLFNIAMHLKQGNSIIALLEKMVHNQSITINNLLTVTKSITGSSKSDAKNK